MVGTAAVVVERMVLLPPTLLRARTMLTQATAVVEDMARMARRLTHRELVVIATTGTQRIHNRACTSALLQGVVDVKLLLQTMPDMRDCPASARRLRHLHRQRILRLPMEATPTAGMVDTVLLLMATEAPRPHAAAAGVAVALAVAVQAEAPTTLPTLVAVAHTAHSTEVLFSPHPRTHMAWKRSFLMYHVSDSRIND